MTNTKEKKFNKSAPHLPVRNLQETLDFYRDKLGFYEEWTWGKKDGGIRRDDMRLLFGEEPGLIELINSESHRLPIMWFVDNIEEIYAEFQEREIKMAEGLKIHPYGLKEFAFIDINGYYIRVAEGADK